MKKFISDRIGDLKVEGRYNNGVIISQGKVSLFGNDKDKIRIINQYYFCILFFYLSKMISNIN
jgi:hypothetical protein